MNFFISLKHWKLFLLVWGLPLLIISSSINNFQEYQYRFIIMTALFGFFSYGWIWSIASTLHPLLPNDVTLNLKRFRILFTIPIAYFILLLLGMTIMLLKNGSSGIISDNEMIVAGIIISILHLSSIAIIIWAMRFAAKTLKSIELGRMAHAGDYILDFFLIWISFIGIWFIQPRLNNLYPQLKDQSKANASSN